MEERGPSYILGGNVNWYSRYGKQYRGFSKKTNKQKNGVAICPGILLLGMYLEKTIIQKDTCTPLVYAPPEYYSQ